MKQMVDLGIGRQALASQLVASGYWGTPDLRRRNAYVLSPCAYAISARQAGDLERLAKCTYSALRCLSTRLSQLALEKSLTNDDARFLAMATRNTRGLLSPREIGGCVPPAVKVDLVQDASGRYFIAEVDAYNPRGFGYFALLDSTLPDAFRSQDKSVGKLARLLRMVNGTEGVWHILVADFERYYEPSFRILASALTAHGIECALVRESEVTKLCAMSSETAKIICIPESLSGGTPVRDMLVRSVADGRIATFYPPAAYLGSKAFLPYLASCTGMEEFVPTCALVAKRLDPRAGMNGSPLVLKGVMSSGLKKVVFSDFEQERFDTLYAEARTTRNPQWILQKRVEQEAIPMKVFDRDGGIVENKYFLRITAYITESGLLGAEVTGRTDPAVHGAPDCIQIPAIYA